MLNIYSRFNLFIRSSISAWQNYWSFALNKLYLIISILLQVIIWWWAIIIYSSSNSDFLIFHYTVDFGIDLIGPPSFVFILITIVLFFNLSNLILSLVFADKKEAKRLWHLFGVANLLINVFVLLVLLAFYLINFNF